MIARTISIKKEIERAIENVITNVVLPPACKGIRFLHSSAEIFDYEKISVVISTNDTTNYDEISHGTHLAKVPLNIDVFLPEDPENDRLIELIAAEILKDRSLNGNAIDIKLVDTEVNRLAGGERIQVLMFLFEVQIFLRAQNAAR